MPLTITNSNQKSKFWIFLDSDVGTPPPIFVHPFYDVLSVPMVPKRVLGICERVLWNLLRAVIWCLCQNRLAGGVGDQMLNP